ncbi:MAG: phage holin family protein [Bacteroidales bacterium]|nr:phage holin family protein [Bacteroidales bacterium]
MIVLDDINETVNDTAKTTQHLAELHVERAKLDAAEGLSTVSIKAISAVIKLVLLCNVIFFISMGLALVIGELTGIPSLGFFIIGAIFIILMIVFACIKKKIIERPVVRMYLSLFFKDK